MSCVYIDKRSVSIWMFFYSALGCVSQLCFRRMQCEKKELLTEGVCVCVCVCVYIHNIYIYIYIYTYIHIYTHTHTHTHTYRYDGAKGKPLWLSQLPLREIYILFFYVFIEHWQSKRLCVTINHKSGLFCLKILEKYEAWRATGGKNIFTSIIQILQLN